jgi:hypothetical protein
MTITLAIAAFFTVPPNKAINNKISGKNAKHIMAYKGPYAKDIIIPERNVEIEKIMFENFSPIETYIVAKFSPIYDGNYDIFCFSKKAISYFKRACIYLLLRSNEIFSAKCCQKAKYTYPKIHKPTPTRVI